jgi:hypothetical protein
VRCDVLIADANIDVTEVDDVADILRGTIVLLVLHDGVPWRFLDSRRVATVPAEKIGVRLV